MLEVVMMSSDVIYCRASIKYNHKRATIYRPAVFPRKGLLF